MTNEKAKQAVGIHIKKLHFYLFVPVFYLMALTYITPRIAVSHHLPLIFFSALIGSVPILAVNFQVVTDAMAELNCRKCIFKATLFLQLLSILLITCVGFIFTRYIF